MTAGSEPDGLGYGDDGASHRAARPPRAVLVDVPWRHRLSTKLLAISALVALAALAGLFIAERRMQRDLVHQLTRSTALLSEAVLETSRESFLAQRGAGHTYGSY